MPGAKSQVIDLDLLGDPLKGFPDDPRREGGIEGHVSIAPTTPEGEVDLELLREWAATRKTDRPHRLTDLIKQALAQENVKRPR